MRQLSCAMFVADVARRLEDFAVVPVRSVWPAHLPGSRFGAAEIADPVTGARVLPMTLVSNYQTEYRHVDGDQYTCEEIACTLLCAQYSLLYYTCV